MRKTLLAMMTLALGLSGCAWEPVAAQEHERQSPHVCHAITDPDSFIKAAAAKSAVMTITRADEFGKATGYKAVTVIAAFVLPDDTTLILVGRKPDGAFSECFTSVYEDGDTWAAVQKFFGRGV